MRVFVVADAQTVLAFALAGVRGQVAGSPEEVPDILEGIDREETGLVLITEALAQANRGVVEKMLLEPDGPLVLEIPDATGPMAGRAKAAERIASLLKH